MKRQLHIGGTQVSPNWEIFNIQQDKGVDYVGDAENLKRFPDETFDKVYASHVLEHFDGRVITKVLTEWYRVLKPDGLLYLSVPDMDIICELFLDKALSLKSRIKLLNIIYGGHTDSYDYHYFGFDLQLLVGYLESAGFKGADKTEIFGIFADSSGILLHDKLISINVIARKTEKRKVDAGNKERTQQQEN